MERLLIPAGEGRAIRVAAGQQFRVIDVAGGQVGDLFAFIEGDVAEFMSMEHTRPSTRHMTPMPGDMLLTNRRQPILRFDDDTSPGVHDTLYAACDQERYRSLGADDGHRSCAENLRLCMEQTIGTVVTEPQPFNVFMHVEVRANGDLVTHPASSAAGDAVTFTAQRAVVVALSSCPMDIININASHISDLAIEVERSAT
jgi:uncharacterized protein YcgI (DUF1989 family)